MRVTADRAGTVAAPVALPEGEPTTRLLPGEPAYPAGSECPEWTVDGLASRLGTAEPQVCEVVSLMLSGRSFLDPIAPPRRASFDVPGSAGPGSSQAGPAKASAVLADAGCGPVSRGPEASWDRSQPPVPTVRSAARGGGRRGQAMLFHMLGPVEAHTPDGSPITLPAGKPTAVLAVLLLNVNRWVPVRQVMSAVWPEDAMPSSAAANLKTYVWQLRKALPEAVCGARIDSGAGRYRLGVEPDEVDVDRAEGMAGEARQALTDGRLAAAVELFTAALGLWRGEPCDGVQFAVPSCVLARLVELRRELQEGLATTYVRVGRTREAIALCRVLTDEDPFRERSWALWMRALNDDGRRAEALGVYDRVRTVLSDELGTAPGRELSDALAAVRRGRPASFPSRRRELARDVPDFTGRAAEIARLCALGADGGDAVPVAVVDGMPGVGKTALAVRVAHRLAPAFPDAQLQVELGDTGPVEALTRLLRAIGVEEEDMPAGTAALAAQWRAELAHRRVLVLLDDARGTEQVLPLLPGGPGSLVLVTTRTRTLRLGGVCAVRLGPLPDTEAATLFRRVVADDRVADAAGVAEVVRLCGGSPTALRAAADTLLNRPQWTIGHLVDRLAHRHAPELAPAVVPIASALRRLPDEPLHVLRALADQPEDSEDGALPALAGRSPADVWRAVEHLVDEHLVQQSSIGRYRLHPLVRRATVVAGPDIGGTRG